jgi:hypothetical protein
MPLEFPAAAERRQRTRAFVKVQDGCNNRCTFCIVTALRGASRSRPLAEVVAEVQQLAAEGVQEAVLTGVHLGSYGRDLDGAARTDLKHLVAALLTHTDIPRLRLSSLEPWELADGFFDLWAQWPGRLCPHLHLPLQAGADRQLRAMARRCTAASFAQLLATARAAIPDLTVTTDLIVGFPGETDDDFAAGLAYVAAQRFLHAHIFPYSARAGTAAASFADATPAATKRARQQQIAAVVAATGAEERARFLGALRPVLWEGAGQPLADQPGRLWSGLTDNYLRVHTIAPAAADLHNLHPAHATDRPRRRQSLPARSWGTGPHFTIQNSSFTIHNSTPQPPWLWLDHAARAHAVPGVWRADHRGRRQPRHGMRLLPHAVCGCRQHGPAHAAPGHAAARRRCPQRRRPSRSKPAPPMGAAVSWLPSCGSWLGRCWSLRSSCRWRCCCPPMQRAACRSPMRWPAV